MPPGPNTNFASYLLGTATWFVGMSIQFILFPALVALALRAPPEQVGTAQMTLMLPMLFLLLPAGALADRHDPRRIVLGAQLAAIVPPLVLAFLIYRNALSFPALIVYGLVMGTLSAVISPAREGLVARLAGGNLQRAVTAATGVQFGVQVLGSLLIYVTPPRYGAIPILIAQAFLYGVGVWAFARIDLPPETRHAAHGHASLAMIVDGLRVSLASTRLRAIMTLNLASGMLYMGVFLVAIPLLVRDVFGGTIREMALANTFNQLGTILATLALLRLGGVRRTGRTLTIALLASATMIAALGWVESFALMLGVILLSGLAAGTGFIMSRTVVQEAAPDSHRNRVIALFTLSALGGSPLGSLAAGFLAGQIGVQGALIVVAALMALTAVAVSAGTGLLRS